MTETYYSTLTAEQRAALSVLRFVTGTALAVLGLYVLALIVICCRLCGLRVRLDLPRALRWAYATSCTSEMVGAFAELRRSHRQAVAEHEAALVRGAAMVWNVQPPVWNTAPAWQPAPVSPAFAR